MQKEQENNIKAEAKMGKIDYKKLLQDVKKNKKYFFIVLPIVLVVVALLSLCVPNYYNCTVKLAPELTNNTAKRAGSLSSIASSLGINLGSSSNDGEALYPMLYPELMNSVTFRTSLFPIKVQREEGGKVMTYYDYLLKGQKSPWWSKIMPAITKAIGSLFTSEKKEVPNHDVNTFRLTKEQSVIANVIAKKVVCDVDKKTMVITINVTDQDPVIAATMADSVQAKLQEFITDYRTSKARIDLERNQALYAETKAHYEKALLDYSNYADANQKVFLERVRSKQTKLQNELSILTQAYTQRSAQLMASEAKVQEETPAFTTLQPATVPLKKSGPKRAQACLIGLFLAFICVTLYCFHKEGDLIPLVKSLMGQDGDEEVEK